MSNSYFITTSIPYVNSRPHAGHAQEFSLADAISRFHRQRGSNTWLQSGTDDNAFKNVLSAREAGIDTKLFVDQNADKFAHLLKVLNIETDFFIRTSSAAHTKSVNHFLSQLKKDDIYTSSYSGLYCQGCEDFYNAADLIDGLCPDHRKPPEEIQEENVFFKLSKYQQAIFELIEKDKVLIKPEHRKKEVLNFIEGGLNDISISRSSLRSGGWGIPFPHFPDQVVYVWIDALINYLSGPGFGQGDSWKEIWNEDVYKIHVIGKNVWKFHAIYWIGLLLSAGLPLPNEILIHGFLTNEGVKISKSLGNGGDPIEIAKKYGADTLRFHLLAKLSYTEDADFSEKGLLTSYNSDLANKFGNLVSRILALRNKAGLPVVCESSCSNLGAESFDESVALAFKLIQLVNIEINHIKPWELLNENSSSILRSYLTKWLSQLGEIRSLLAPVLPNSCKKLENLLASIKPQEDQLFPRR